MRWVWGRGRKGFVVGVALLVASLTTLAAGPSTEADRIAFGAKLRQQGLLDSAIAELEAVREAANSERVKTLAAGELGITLLQARRLDSAAEFLRLAHDNAMGAEKARYAVYLGNLALIRKQADQARASYQEALDLAPADRDVQIAVGLNLVRVLPPADRLARLRTLSAQLDDAPAGPERAAQHLNLGNQARQAGAGGVEFAYRHLTRAAELASASGDQRLLVQADDVLAQLYEDQGRGADAVALTRRAIERARGLNASLASDLLIQLDWRLGRLAGAAGRLAESQAAYQRAVAQIEAIRQDIPITYEDGRSSFAAMLEPVYTGYIDSVLRQLDSQPPATQATQLRSVVQAIESMRQSEIQDFLGDRCTVEAVQGGASGALPAGSAVLYPVALGDRLELLLVTPNGILRKTAPVSAARLKTTAEDLSRRLRDGLEGYMDASRQLYDWILRPVEGSLGEAVDALVVAPSGVLRLVPMAVLNDGERFAIERRALSVVTGLSMTNMSPRPGRRVEALVAGVSYPGPVVEKLDRAMMAAVAESEEPAANEVRGLSSRPQTRAIRAVRAGRGTGEATDPLRERFALPGVKEEVDALRTILPGANMLNQEFTVGQFSQAAESGRFRIVHIATHGFFGGSAETSFIMAYDDLLTIDGLQSLLKSENFEKNPIELLSLSACQTAQGNDRAPLGISGAAIKARAKSVIGTLWPVDDDAAKTLMQALYTGITRDGLSKTEALRRAQLELLRANRSQAPFFWAPFVLIGNWL